MELREVGYKDDREVVRDRISKWAILDKEPKCKEKYRRRKVK